MMRFNQFNQPIGDEVSQFRVGEYPNIGVLQGKYCRLERLALHHCDDLYAVYSSALHNWTYLPCQPVQSKAECQARILQWISANDPYHLAIIDQQTNKAVGTFALMRTDINNRSIEVGWVIFGDELKRTRQATEAHYLLASYVFETLQYRRYEWKCDALNVPSRRSAERLGFVFEGVFRQAVVYHNRNRDTAWFSMLDKEWPQRKICFERWLQEDNFDDQGQQKTKLG